MVVGGFGTKYANIRPTKDRRIIPIPRETLNIQQENNATVNNAVDEIILTQNVSATNHEAPEFLDSDYDVKDLYKVDKMSLEETK